MICIKYLMGQRVQDPFVLFPPRTYLIRGLFVVPPNGRIFFLYVLLYCMWICEEGWVDLKESVLKSKRKFIEVSQHNFFHPIRKEPKWIVLCEPRKVGLVDFHSIIFFMGFCPILIRTKLVGSWTYDLHQKGTCTPTQASR